MCIKTYHVYIDRSKAKPEKINLERDTPDEQNLKSLRYTPNRSKT